VDYVCEQEAKGLKLSCEDYQDELQRDHLLSKDELADHLRRFVSYFNLNVITSANIQSTGYNVLTKKWRIKVETPVAVVTVIAKHVVQATGIGSQKPHIPIMANAHVYRGITIHSSDYRNGQRLADRGVKVSHFSLSVHTPSDM
jgi:cation diffusion facilitator CzcD-associated flavoprotein CzcO